MLATLITDVLHCLQLEGYKELGMDMLRRGVTYHDIGLVYNARLNDAELLSLPKGALEDYKRCDLSTDRNDYGIVFRHISYWAQQLSNLQVEKRMDWKSAEVLFKFGELFKSQRRRHSIAASVESVWSATGNTNSYCNLEKNGKNLEVSNQPTTVLAFVFLYFARSLLY